MFTSDEKHDLEQKLTSILSAGCGMPEPIEVRIQRCIQLFETILIAREGDE